MKVKKKQLGFRFTPFRVTPCWGCMLTLHLAGEVVYGCCLLGFVKLVSCFTPRWVGELTFMLTSC